MVKRILTDESPDEALEIALVALDEGDDESARDALRYALHDLNMNYKDALESQLTRLMMHILKWRIQPERRSGSWAGSIANARHEISRIQRRKPSLNRRFVESIWEDCFRAALREAQAETVVKAFSVNVLTWRETFKEEYFIAKEQ